MPLETNQTCSILSFPRRISLLGNRVIKGFPDFDPKPINPPVAIEPKLFSVFRVLFRVLSRVDPSAPWIDGEVGEKRDVVVLVSQSMSEYSLSSPRQRFWFPTHSMVRTRSLIAYSCEYIDKVGKHHFIHSSVIVADKSIIGIPLYR